jgi:hypothetical protein
MTTFKSDIIESLSIVPDEDRLFEATLYRGHDTGVRTVSINMNDADVGVDVRYDLDEIRSIVATLGHLLYLAETHEDA